MKTKQTGKPILDALLNASESFAEQGETSRRVAVATREAQPAHSPLPWQIGQSIGNIYNAKKFTIFEAVDVLDITADANAKLIVRAVNAMPAAEALAEIVKEATDGGWLLDKRGYKTDFFNKADAALKAWKEQQP